MSSTHPIRLRCLLPALLGLVLPAALLQPAAAGPICQLGNPPDTFAQLNNWMQGGETFHHVFTAGAGTCSCAEGIKITQVQFVMSLGPEDVPIDFHVMGSVSETVWDESRNCSVPGPMICSSEVQRVQIDNPGRYGIIMPLAGDGCACASLGHDYTLSVLLVSTFNDFPDVVTDQQPLGCTSFHERAGVLTDLQDFGFPGELVLFGDAICCNPPLDAGTLGWGRLKSTYR